MVQQRSKILHIATKNQCSQINTIFFFLKKENLYAGKRDGLGKVLILKEPRAHRRKACEQAGNLEGTWYSRGT